MSEPEYWPDAGDLVWTDFNPTRGREQAGRRPALAISPKAFALNTGLVLVCPITARIRPFPTSVVLPQGLPIAGEILISHLNSPNDVCVRSDGSIIFTDPWYGRMRGFGVERPCELGFQGVYRVANDGSLHLLVERDLFDQPNGLCFSPDEATLYVNDSERALIRAFRLAADGSLSGGEIFASGVRSEAEPGAPDGMKCDAEGNVWVTVPGGVWVYAPSGALIGKLGVPELVANLAWGGESFRTLFLTASRSVYAVRTKVGPRREPYMARRRRAELQGGLA